MNRFDIISYYKSCRSIKGTARIFQISTQTVRKLLIDAREYTSPMSEKVRKLYESGQTPQEIMKILECSYSTVQAYLPYCRPSYSVDEKSKNAEHIARWRKRKYEG